MFERRDKRKEKKVYRYDCTITGKSYKLTEKSDTPDELISVEAYYQLNPEKDDRPLVIKKKLELLSEEKA